MKDVNLTGASILKEEQTEPNKHRKKINIKKILPLLIVLTILTFTAIPVIVMHIYIDRHVSYKETYFAKDFGVSSERLNLETSDGLSVVAHEVYLKDPKAVVIFISGIYNPSVTAFFGHARMLHENGYASMLLELRAHGESDGDVICLGYKEHLDVKAVVDYIKQNNNYKDVPIVVYGVSMGGATAINSIGEIKEISGLISASAYSSWEDVFCDTMTGMGIPKAIVSIQKPFVKLYTTAKFGSESSNINPKDEIKKIGDRPALIIHSKGDSSVPFSNFERIMGCAPKHVESFTREGDLHFILESRNFLNPQNDKEYMERIIGFLNKYFTK